VSVRSSGTASLTAKAAALDEQQRIARLIEDGTEMGHTFEWR
jgi:hypothetical protein